MTTQTQLKPKIERVEREWALTSKLSISHEDGYVTFAYPSFGQNNYLENGKENTLI